MTSLPCLSLLLSLPQPAVDNPLQPPTNAQATKSKNPILGEYCPLFCRVQPHARVEGNPGGVLRQNTEMSSLRGKQRASVLGSSTPILGSSQHRLERADKAVPLHLRSLPRGLTFGIQLGPVTLKAFEPHHIAQQGEELHEGCSCLLVVVHLFLRALASPAVQDAHLPLEAQL